MKSLPWILLGTGAIGLTAVLVLHNKRAPALPPGPLTPQVKSKVAASIASSNDPNFLKQLATGLQKSGAIDDAMAALKKAADVSGIAQVLPSANGQPILAITPSPTMAIPTQYKVVAGDIPGAIATRFGLTLSVLAKANGINQKRIMAGQIKPGETLTLPPHTVDKGSINHAKGTVS